MNLLGGTKTEIKYTKGHGKHAETGYTAEWGQIYKHRLNCSIMEVCNGIQMKRVSFFNEPRLEEVTRKLLFLWEKGLGIDGI